MVTGKERGRVMNIKEIARRAGVSSATISRVLNNSGYVKEETRQKVLKAVDEYNYVQRHRQKPEHSGQLKRGNHYPGY